MMLSLLGTVEWNQHWFGGIALVVIGVGLWLAVCLLPPLPRVRRYLKLLFLARYSVLMGILLPLLGLLVALSDFGEGLVENLFVLDRFWPFFWLTLLSMLVAAMVILTFLTTWDNALERFPEPLPVEGSVSPPQPKAHLGTAWRGPLTWLLFAAIGLPVPLVCLVLSWNDVEAGSQAYLLGGMALGVVLATGALFLLLGLGAAKRSADRDSDRRWYTGALRRLGPGYVDASGRLLPGHARVTWCLIVLLAFYTISFLLGPNRDWFPPLAYVLLILLMVGFALTGLAFLFDYSHMPVLLVLTAISCGLYWFARTDHFYKVHWPKPEQTQTEPLLLHQVFTQDSWKNRLAYTPDAGARPPAQSEFPPSHRKTLVVVTAAGGGIQASAWAAHVLCELHKRYRGPFLSSLGLVSSVSGGSVGVMFYLDQWEPNWDRVQGPVMDKETQKKIEENAQGSCLEAAAWGASHSDLVRLVFPPLVDSGRDRGTAVEDVWRQRLREPKARLSNWQEHVKQGRLPVVVFNSTLVETGQRFCVSPVVRDTGDEPAGTRERQFLKLYDQADLDIVAAARLSATFAYVSPICRPAPEGRVTTGPGNDYYHVADGGYVDSEGMFTATAWLLDLLKHYPPEKARPFTRVVLVRIQPFPESKPQPAQAAGWTFAVTGPLTALEKVRVASQTDRNDLAADLLEEASGAPVKTQRQVPGKPKPRVGSLAGIEVVSVKFIYRPTGDTVTPLSWRLTEKQKDGIIKGWKAIEEIAAEPDDKIAAEKDPDNPLRILDRFYKAHPGN